MDDKESFFRILLCLLTRKCPPILVLLTSTPAYSFLLLFPPQPLLANTNLENLRSLHTLKSLALNSGWLHLDSMMLSNTLLVFYPFYSDELNVANVARAMATSIFKIRLGLKLSIFHGGGKLIVFTF